MDVTWVVDDKEVKASIRVADGCNICWDLCGGISKIHVAAKCMLNKVNSG